jgi:hypothetical protein
MKPLSKPSLNSVKTVRWNRLATALDIEIWESATKHSVTLKQVESWLASTSASPHVASKKTRLKMTLMTGRA